MSKSTERPSEAAMRRAMEEMEERKTRTGIEGLTEQAEEVVRLILDGYCDHDLSTVAQAVRDRQDEIALEGARRLTVGDTVTFTAPISPKYLIGQEARVTKVNRKSVVVDVPDEPSYRRFRGATGVRCPISCIATEV